MYELNDKEYKYISSKVYDYAKINLTEQKRPLIVSRLSKRIRALNLDGFPAYVDFLKKDETGKEFEMMVDSLSTNFSLFFREAHHFDFVREDVLPGKSTEELTLWSAAASTGQEIYSLLMTILEYERDTGKKIRCKLYASDISRGALQKAAKGIYNIQDIQDMDRPIKERYFLKGKGENSDLVKVKKALSDKVEFFRLNLNDPQYRLPPMDIIFLRNAIIYFDYATKKELIDRLYNYIKPGGYLILGHSESLSGFSERFQLIGKTIYRRID